MNSLERGSPSSSCATCVTSERCCCRSIFQGFEHHWLDIFWLLVVREHEHQILACTLIRHVVLTFLGRRLMIMMMVTRTQTHLHQPWRLDRCNHSFIHICIRERPLCCCPRVGWYPQIAQNCLSKSVVGISFDQAIYNFLGFLCYSTFNCALYFDPHVQSAYRCAFLSRQA